MNKNKTSSIIKNHHLKWVGYITAGILITLLAVHIYANYKVQSLVINSLPENVKMETKGFYCNIFKSTICSDSIYLTISNQANQDTHTIITTKEIKIGSVSIYDYLFNDKFTIDQISINQPQILHHKHLKTDSASTDSSAQQLPFIQIKNIHITNTELLVKGAKNQRNFLSLNNLELHLKNVAFHPDSTYNRIPFSYDLKNVSAKKFQIKTGEYEDVFVKQLEWKEDILKMDSMRFFTVYPNDQYRKILKNPRTHYDVQNKSISIHKPILQDNEVLLVGGEKMTINNSWAIFHKDKSIGSDNETNELYGKRLREAPLDIAFDKIEIINSYIEYGEMKDPNKEGTLMFDNIYASLYNVGNVYSQPIEIDVKARFMKEADIKVDWKFDVSDETDTFSFIAEVGTMPAAALDTFMRPLEDIELEGKLKSAHINVTADKASSSCKLDITYEALKINLLNDQNEERDLISSVANWFVNENSNEEGINEASSTTETKRDATWSYWKYIWKSIFASLKESTLYII